MAQKKRKENEEIIEETTEKNEKDTRKEEIELIETKKALEEKTAKLDEVQDKYLRLLAEYDNFKKRTVKEKDDIYFNAKCDVLKKLLPIFDNFERAEKFSSSDEFQEGVKMIIKQFFETLNEMDVHEIEALDKEFDPNLHEAVFHDEKEGIPENTVTEVLQKGYISGEKVLRHAMVKVTN